MECFSSSKDEAKARMDGDPDIKAESDALRRIKLQHIPLNWKPNTGGHRASPNTVALYEEAGGRAAILSMTTAFYQKAFNDPHLDQFLRDHSDPHGSRFADWISEKFGMGQPWTAERSSRKTCPFASHGHTLESPHDRSSAHFAAWHSPKREAGKFGEHFKLDDCRVWMRLHFWAMREVGIPEASPEFADYYVRFIGHFVSVYERSAPGFARDSYRWSANPANIEAYKSAGNRMVDVIGVGLQEAGRGLPEEERGDRRWPYEY